MYNQPEYTKEIVNNFRQTIGEINVKEVPPVMAGEDFSRYGRTEKKIPSALFWLGAVDPEKYAEAKANNTGLPSLHSSKFAPVPESTIKTGITGMTGAALMLLNKNQ